MQSTEAESLCRFDLPMLSRTLDEFVKLGMWEEALEVISTFEDQIIAASQASDPAENTFLDLNRQRHLDLARRIASFIRLPCWQ